MTTRSLRLGVRQAVVDGALVPGDVQIDPESGVVSAVGLDSPDGIGTAVAGLVDLQVNGFAGVDLRSADIEDYAHVAEALARRGVTAFQPTLHSQSLDGYVAALEVLSAVLLEHRNRGARVMAAHLEGPFLSPRWPGAHDPDCLLVPDARVLDRLLDAGPVGFMTLAPELPGAQETIVDLVDNGIVVGIGHSDATAEQVHAAVETGAQHLTHCWNAHRRFAPRDPGPAGAALADDRVVVGLVADLFHVAPETLLFSFAAAPSRVAVTCDAVAAAGLERTGVAHGGVEHAGIEHEGPERRSDGTIAGGLVGPDDCLRNLVALGVDLADAVDACGGVQRSLLGLPEVRLRPGDPADVALLSEELEVLATYVDGESVFERT